MEYLEIEKDLKVEVLCSLRDLLGKCEQENVRVSEQTNKYLKCLIIERLGIRKTQQLMKKLVEKGDKKWDSPDGYEVESILNYCKDVEDQEYYLIKWKGWSHKYDTWEPKENLTCSDLIDEYHKLQIGLNTYKSTKRKRDDQTSPDSHTAKRQLVHQAEWENVTPLDMLKACDPNGSKSQSKFAGLIEPQRREARTRAIKYNNKSGTFRKRKQEVQSALAAWQRHINKVEGISHHAYMIYVENTVDMEGPPSNFDYIADYRAGANVEINEDPVIGCECENCITEKKTCCAAAGGCDFAYYHNGGVRLPPRSAIYECNKRCQCGPDCKNRVVQKGRKNKVCIFRTTSGMGWGVKAMSKIKKGSFVMEYVGEIIREEEAERRGAEYDMQRQTYLFDLDYQQDEQLYTVDAGSCGNVAHFINHSCDPNLATYAVWINNLDVHMPRIAFFALRDIQKGEELTFDYMMNRDASLDPEAKVSNKETVQQENPETDTDTESESEAKRESKLNNLEAPKIPTEETKETREKPETISEAVFAVPTVTNKEVSDTDSGIGVSVDGDKSDKISDISWSQPDNNRSSPKAGSGFFSPRSPEVTKIFRGRIKCLCGAANCRKYLF